MNRNDEEPALAAGTQDTADWIRRCIARMNALNPSLLHGDVASIAEDMSRRSHWRQMSPEAAADEAVDPPAVRQPRGHDGSENAGAALL